MVLLREISDEHESHADTLYTGAAFFRDLKRRTLFAFFKRSQCGFFLGQGFGLEFFSGFHTARRGDGGHVRHGRRPGRPHRA